MPFSFEPLPLKKQNFAKRHPVLLPLGAFLALIVSISFFSQEPVKPMIGVVNVNGVIIESEGIVRKLRELENNPSIHGIILRINSPGGAVAPSQEIFTELLRLKKKKRIYTSISSVAASGGYYVAIGSDRIFANPGSVTGSIGVIMQSYNVEELMRKIGIRSQVIKSGKNKDVGSIFRMMRPEERKLLESVIKDTHDQFVSAIAENRELEKADVEKLADGRIFTGRQALNLGLIDELASFRQVVDSLRRDLEISEEVQLFYPPDEKKSFWDQIPLSSLLNLKESLPQSGLFYLGSSLPFMGE